MNFLILLLFVAFFAATPTLAFEYLVMPELADLAETYSNFDRTAHEIAYGGR